MFFWIPLAFVVMSHFLLLILLIGIPCLFVLVNFNMHLLIFFSFLVVCFLQRIMSLGFFFFWLFVVCISLYFINFSFEFNYFSPLFFGIVSSWFSKLSSVPLSYYDVISFFCRHLVIWTCFKELPSLFPHKFWHIVFLFSFNSKKN